MIPLHDDNPTERFPLRHKSPGWGASGGMSVGAQGGGVAFFAHIGGFIAGTGLDRPVQTPGRTVLFTRPFTPVGPLTMRPDAR